MVQVLNAPLQIQILATALRKAEDGPDVWVPATYKGDPDEGPVLAWPPQPSGE